MKVFEVGGAVRDRLLGLTVHDRDWVVVGGTAEALLQQGYKPVGEAFPVFLHPETAEQYALARTERKVGPGYHGFSFDASADVTLDEDLRRRDLTINAMARDAEGRVIDPFGGRGDLEARLLRHVSDAFAEDPLRVLRVARFAARFRDLGFTVAAPTMELMRNMVAAGETAALQPDRVWQETEKALAGPNPAVYFRVLRRCDALSVVFPEIEALFGVPQPAKWHPEIDTGIHTLMALEVAAKLSESVAVRFAALTHDLGKAATPKDMLPRHRGHEARSVRILDSLCSRLPVPRRHRELATAVARYHGAVHRAGELKPGTVYDLIEAVDGVRRPERFEGFLLACEADARGRSGLEDRPYPQAGVLRTALDAARRVRGRDVPAATPGAAFGARLRERRIAAIREVLGNTRRSRPLSSKQSPA